MVLFAQGTLKAALHLLLILTVSSWMLLKCRAQSKKHIFTDASTPVSSGTMELLPLSA